MAVSDYSHIWECKQYYRTCWSMDYLQQGHVDLNFFPSLLLLLYLCVFFLSADLTITLLTVHAPSV